MKKIGLILGAILLMTTASFAQEDKKEHAKKSPKQKAELHTKKLTEDLELTPEQSEKVYAINIGHVEEMEAIKKQMKALKKEAKEKKKAHHEELKKVLTVEQQKKLDTRKEEHKKKREEMRKKHE